MQKELNKDAIIRYRMEFAARLDRCRCQSRLSVKELAFRAVIDESKLSMILRGKYSPGLDVLCRICAAMDSYLDILPFVDVEQMLKDNG